MLDGCNYRDFVRFLAAFSSRATIDAKAEFMFECYDVDGDGIVSADDLRNMLHYLVAGHLTDDQVDNVIQRCLKDASGSDGVTVEDFKRLADPASLKVQVPQRL